MGKTVIIKEDQLRLFNEGIGSEFEVKTIADKDYIEKNIMRIWEIFQISYGEGNFKTARSPKALLRSIGLLKFVEINGTMVACATYRDLGGYKMNAIGCDKSIEGAKEALQSIIKDDIKRYKEWFWAEVSDAVEHYFKKIGGYPIPNVYASELLDKEVELCDDGAHYKRPIGIDGEVYTKIIYGFKDENLYNKVMEEISNYEDFAEKVNSLTETITAYGLEIKKATYIIENVYRAHTEDGFNEMPPKWKKLMLWAKDILIKSKLSEKDKTIASYLNLCEYLLHEMPELKLNRF